MGYVDPKSIDYWEKLFSETSFTNYVDTLSNLNEAFVLSDRSIRCIDEGCCGGLRMAGSGILYQGQAESALTGKADGVYSHEECGAAALYAKLNSLNPDNADQYGIEWAKNLADKLGVPYKGHIGIDNMVRPSGKHIAQVTYYDGSGQFEPSRLKSLPPGFVISRSLLDAEYAKQELRVSINIALGEHGLGKRFIPLTPFIIVPIGNPDDDKLSLDILTQEARSIAKAFNGRVVVNGFTAPIKEQNLFTNSW